mmetsp:Transcript_41220/g.93213  ORF Transcript_41220/g.93213 Transcript_41220/m.93213 type:complete len:228 (-) Transcript_41220:282-965(-)
MSFCRFNNQLAWIMYQTWIFFSLLAFCSGCSESDRPGSDQKIQRIGRRLALDLEQLLDTEGVPAHVHCRVSEHSQKAYVTGRAADLSIPSRHAVFYEDADDLEHHMDRHPDEFKSAEVEQLRQFQPKKPPEVDVGGSQSRWAASLSARDHYSERSWGGTPRCETDLVAALLTPAGQLPTTVGSLPVEFDKVSFQPVSAIGHTFASDSLGARLDDVWADVWTSPRTGG